MIQFAGQQARLQSGWTEHKAPSGHVYYYNAATKQSTYVRPVAPQAVPPPQPVQQPGFATGANFIPLGDSVTSEQPWRAQPAHLSGDHRRNRQPNDRPKSKKAITGCAPWILVGTRLRRRFVHNPETGESFWKFPEHVAKAVVQLDIEESQRIARRARGEKSPSPPKKPAHDEKKTGQIELSNEGEAIGFIDGGVPHTAKANQARNGTAGAENDDDEEEIEEIIEEEDDDGEGGYQPENGGPAADRQRAEGEPDPQGDQQMELGEDDMAWQLEQMGQAYELDPGEYGGEGDGDLEEGAEGLPMTDEEVTAFFEDLLEDFKISPYATWDNIIEEGRIVQDDRYTLLPSMKSRREAFASWSSRKAQQLKEQREKQGKRNPKIPYLSLLQQHASPKLYWPEFKRKYRKEPEMKDLKLSDKEREKLYREHINRTTKMTEPELKRDLQKLMQSIPASHAWNQSTPFDGTLPEALLADVRFISLKPSARDAALRAFIQTLPAADEVDDAQQSAERVQERAKRAKRDQALKDRQQQVEEEKRRQQRDRRGRLQGTQE